MRPFVPHPLLRQRHVMTVAGAFWPRRTPRLPQAQERLFEVEAGTQILAKCHWQSKRDSPTLVLVHGLEGSSESGYIRGAAEKAFLSGFHVLRLNQRNCGGSDRLTPTVYNSGLSGDFRAVLEELISRDGLRDICFAGYSMGGNLVLKMAGELGAAAPAELMAVCGICPTPNLRFAWTPSRSRKIASIRGTSCAASRPAYGARRGCFPAGLISAGSNACERFASSTT